MIGQQFRSRATSDIYTIIRMTNQTVTLMVGNDEFDVNPAKFDRWVIEGDLILL